MNGLAERTSLDRVLECLAAEDRRRLLLELVAREGTSDVQLPDDLDVPDEDPRAVQIRMRHVHLPKLAANGFVHWDRDRQTVRPGPRFDDVEPVVRLLDEHADELPEWP